MSPAASEKSRSVFYPATEVPVEGINFVAADITQGQGESSGARPVHESKPPTDSRLRSPMSATLSSF